MSGFEIVELALTEHVPNEENVKCEDDKWQKLVLYYLARLKGLCDWRNNNSRSKVKQNPKIHLKRCSSQELESRIIDNVTNKPIARLSKKQNCLDLNDIGTYMAAGYEEGKQQAVKIISRSLKYGVMTGILLKRGNCYRIAPEYLSEPVPKKKKNAKQQQQHDKCTILQHKLSVNGVKTNVRKKKNLPKSASTAKHQKAIEMKKSNVTVKGKKRKCVLNNSCVKKKKVNSATSIKAKKSLKRNYDGNSDENPPNYKKNKRSSDTKVNLIRESSNSKSTFETISRSLTPIEDRHKKRDVKAKRPRPKIQKPINYVPPLKKPRTKSQSKSPSHHTDDDEVKGRENINATSHIIINRFRMPRPRRYSDVMSSMSSTSLSSSCTRCGDNVKIKRTRRK